MKLMSKVLFGSSRVRDLNWQSSLPGKFDAILEKLDFASQLDGKRVCIKMHLGGNVGYSTIHPIFVRRLVSFIKAAGGVPFVTEIREFALTAYERGYSQETIGCPVLPAAGASDAYYHTYPVEYKNLKELKISGEVWDADYLVCLSHAKGHGCSSYGGAIKNIAIGAMARETRGNMHMVQHAESYWDPDKCTHFTDGCTACVDNCGRNTTRFADDNTLHVGFHECDFCLQCNEICPTGALNVKTITADDFQRVMAIAAQAVLSRFTKDNAIFINFATNITPFCDCLGLTSPSLVPDIGIFASRDIVAIEKATLDSIDYRNLIPGSLIESMPLRDTDGHLFEKIHGISPYIQVTASEELGLGNSDYEIEELG